MITVQNRYDGMIQPAAPLGWRLPFGTLTVSGLVEGPNTIPHGLGFKPIRLNLRPGAEGLWGETASPDELNIYITVGAGGALAGRLDYEGVVGG